MANALRVLAMDAVEAAKSGHPGMPMGMSEIAVALWSRHLRHNPDNPSWADRDRFILSNGHGSALLYSLLHLTGYDVTIGDLRRFRQIQSKTRGHPELGHTPGVETTTGPLGQGIANAVGMALAEKLLAKTFNKPSLTIVGHHTYVFLGDGCLMEGLSHEACSLAGTLGLNKLIAFYDQNGISIDGHVEGWFTDDTPKRFEAYGWNVLHEVDGHDIEAVDRAISAARASTERPTLICCRTTIGKGSPNKANSHDSHGAPLGKDEIELTRRAIGWKHQAFEIPAAIYRQWDARPRGATSERRWSEVFAAYRSAYPDLAEEFERRMQHRLPAKFDAFAERVVQETVSHGETIASRKASQNAIERFAAIAPELLGGSADLASSNLTRWKAAAAVTATKAGNYINYGVREFGMSAIMNGVMAHGGWRPFGGTFLVFSDYARNAIRMSAIMKLGVIYVLTHDSIALGQDGPTHQPIEHLATLRLIPNLDVWRPCDTVETASAWRAALEQIDRPTCIALSRQDLPFQKRTNEQISSIRMGGYVLATEEEKLQVIVIATGSEVQLALDVRTRLERGGIGVRVVSMPSTTTFDRQSNDYRSSVIPRHPLRVSIEAAASGLWQKYIGEDGVCIGIDQYGMSAPMEELFDFFCFTAEKIEQQIVAAIKAREI